MLSFVLEIIFCKFATKSGEAESSSGNTTKLKVQSTEVVVMETGTTEAGSMIVEVC